jgi:hypothetical protein
VLTIFALRFSGAMVNAIADRSEASSNRTGLICEDGSEGR